MPISNVSSGLRSGVCTSTTRPSAPYEGQVIYETDTDRVLVWNGTRWSQFGKPHIENRFSTGSGAGTGFANTAWTAFRTDMDISIFANEGDVIEVYINVYQMYVGASSCFYRLDAGIMVSGSRVSFIGTASTSTSRGGFIGGGEPYSGGYTFGKTLRALTASEISNNTVTFRPFISQFGAVSTTLYHSTNEPFYFGAINHGPDLG